MRALVLVATLAVLAVAGCNGHSGSHAMDMSTPPDLTPAGNVDLLQSNNDLSQSSDGGATTAKAHGGLAVMSGAVSASSTNYRVIMSLGQGPGGNGTASSTNAKQYGGLVGATQGK